MKKKCSIIGLGWYGTPLASSLMQSGFDVCGSTRSLEKQEKLSQKGIKTSLLSYPGIPDSELLESDIIVVNIPPFEGQLDWFKSWNWQSKTWTIFISSISVFPQPDSKNAELLLEQENWFQTHFQNWTVLRLGGLLGNGRHPGKHLSGRKNLPGRLWPVNLIHQDDTVDFTKMVIDQNLTKKIFHVVSDEHPTREDFYTEYCRNSGLPLPEFDNTDFSQGKEIPSLGIYHSFKKLI